MTKVSVIVAVYNMEKHLRQCVESVLAQTLKDVEVVCVDDVSTDGSLVASCFSSGGLTCEGS